MGGRRGARREPGAEPDARLAAAHRAAAAGPAASRAAHPLLPRLRRGADRLRDGGGGPAARAGGALGHPPRLRVGEPGLAALDGGALARAHLRPLRRARLRPVRPGPRGRLARGVRARPRDRRRRAGARALPPHGALAGWPRRDRVCRPPPRARQPPRARGRLRQGAGRPGHDPGRAARGGAAGRADPDGLGPRRPVVPALLLVHLHARRAAPAVERLRCADAPHDLRRERAAPQRRLRRDGRHRPRRPGRRADAHPPRPRRHADPLQPGPRDRRPHPGQSARAARHAQPPAARRRAGVGAPARRRSTPSWPRTSPHGVHGKSRSCPRTAARRAGPWSSSQHR